VQAFAWLASSIGPWEGNNNSLWGDSALFRQRLNVNDLLFGSQAISGNFYGVSHQALTLRFDGHLDINRTVPQRIGAPAGG
jgi:hypothetical protein